MQRGCILIVVESPLQVLGAYEAIGYYQRDYVLLLRLSGVERNDLQMVEAANNLKLTFRAVKIRPGHLIEGGIKNAVVFSSIIFRRYEIFISGSYFSNLIRGLVKIKRCFNKFQVVHMDDGVATYLAQKEMKRSGEVESIFTFLNVESLPGQSKVAHSFEMLKQSIGEAEVRGSYFIGQKLVEAGFCDHDTYIKLIDDVRKIHANGSLIYIPHRAESFNNLKRIESMEGVEVVYSEVCMELYFMQQKIEPDKVFSFASTVLFTLPKIYKNSKYYSVYSKKLNLEKAAHAQEILMSLKHGGEVEVLEL